MRTAATGPIEGAALPRLMVGATVALVVLGIALTGIAGPLFDLTADAAADLLERAPYVDAVRGEGVR